MWMKAIVGSLVLATSSFTTPIKSLLYADSDSGYSGVLLLFDKPQNETINEIKNCPILAKTLFNEHSLAYWSVVYNKLYVLKYLVEQKAYSAQDLHNALDVVGKNLESDAFRQTFAFLSGHAPEVCDYWVNQMDWRSIGNIWCNYNDDVMDTYLKKTGKKLDATSTADFIADLSITKTQYKPLSKTLVDALALSSVDFTKTLPESFIAGVIDHCPEKITRVTSASENAMSTMIRKDDLIRVKRLLDSAPKSQRKDLFVRLSCNCLYPQVRQFVYCGDLAAQYGF